MIRLVYSNALELLVTSLLERSAEPASEWTDPTHIIVPNRNIGTYLKLQIARHQGWAANIETTYLYAFFRDLLPPGVELLDRLALQSFILDAFLDPVFMSSEEMSQAFRYVYDQHGVADEKRAVQLARRTSKLFDEYTLTRQSLVDRWPDGLQIDEAIFRESEVWQRALWLELFGENRRAENQTTTLIRLSELPKHIDVGSLPNQIHVFGLSYVALAFYKLFDHLSHHTDLCIYTLNPCMEYWEDVPRGWPVSKRKKRFAKREAEQSALRFGSEDDFGSDDPPALRAWGRPGRDHIHLLNMLTDCDFDAQFYDPTSQSQTLLHQFQRDILTRRPTSEMKPTHHADGSLQMICAPSVHREVEGIADEIWRLINDPNQALNYHDIAVIVNQDEKEIYQSRIRSVFESTHAIPHNIVDITARSNRRFIEAVDLLLNLPFTTFERRPMLRLITHPNVLAKFPRAQRDLWIHWCDALSIFHGGDATDHDGTYVSPNLYHWDQGVTRLTLGAFMSDDEIPVELGENSDRFLPLEVGGTEVADVAAFGALVADLVHDARTIQRARRTITGWATAIRDYILQHLEPSTDDDAISQRWIFERLTKLEAVDYHNREISYEVFWAMLMDELESMRVSRGHYLTDGVVVSSFLPMRPIPFKVVFIAGLGDKQFPQRDPRSPLDLRWVQQFRPQRGDMVSPKARDEYMFLETIISTRDRLYLSYVDRDPQTGEEQQPSEVIRQLEFIMETDYLASGESEELRLHLPLRRHETVHDTFLPQVPFEHDASTLRHALEEESQKQERTRPTWRDLIAIGIPAKPFLDRLGLKSSKVTSNPVDDGIIVIPLAALKRFLRTPLQGSAEFLLNVWSTREQDVFAIEDEAFNLPFYARARFLRDVFHSFMQTPDATLESELLRTIDREILRGTFPSGIFAEAEVERQLNVLETWWANLDRFGFAREEFETLRFDEGDLPALDLGVVDIDFDRRAHVKISGTSGLVSRQFDALSLHPQSYLPADHESWVLDGFIDLMVQSALRQGEGPWRVVLNLSSNISEKHVFDFAPVSTDDARRYLTKIAAEMIEEVHDYVLPADAVFSSHGTNLSLEEAVDRLRSNRFAELHRGPIRNVNDYDLPPHPDAVIERRFGLYFRQRMVDEDV